MTIELLNIFILIGFEFFIFISNVRLTYLITQKYNRKFPNAELIIVWISLNLVFNFMISSILTFMQFNGVIQYFVASIVIFSLLHVYKKSEMNIYKDFLVNTFNKIFYRVVDWKFLIIIGALLPVILFSFRPISSTDSLVFMNYILDWSFNQYLPYTRAWSYVPLWELSYVPQAVISNSDNYFWINSFKPAIIIGLGTYLIGRELKLPSNLIWIALFSSLLYFKLWLPPGSNLGDLKNDIFFGSGIVLIVYSLIRSVRIDFDRLTSILFILGVVFISVKYSGFFLGLISILVFLIINKKRIVQYKKKSIQWLIILFATVFLLTGHYYLYNFIEFGNPFYPVKMSLGLIEFSGKDLSSTSLMANLDQGEVWDVFFPSEKISKGGIFFPAILVFGFVGIPAILFYTGIKFIKTKIIETKLIIISFFSFLTWAWFIVTPYSAENVSGGLVYWVSNELFSTRYVIGTIFLTEILFGYFLWRLKIPKFLIFSFFGITIISRSLILFTGLPRYFDYSLVIFPYIMLVGLVFLGRFRKRFQPKIILLVVIGVSIFIFSPLIVESNRVGWVPWWSNVASYTYELPASKIFLIEEPGNESDIWVRTYPVYGKNFHHTVVVGTQNNLIKDTIEAGFEPPEYVAKLCSINYTECDSNLNKFENDLKPYGYGRVVIDKNAILLKQFG